MTIVNIKGNYLHGLRQSKPEIVYKKSRNPVKALMGIKTQVPIPPLNTDIRFTSLPQFNLQKHRGLMDIKVTTLPENFSWGDDPNLETDPDIKRKKQIISEPPNQALCGSCWAISSASAISDIFIVSNRVKQNPNISTTWALITDKQGQCQGGNPAELFKYIEENGIATQNCIDYSWCLSDPNCNGSALGHFDANGVNAAIPQEAGCYYNVNHYLLYIRDTQHIYINQTGISAENIVSIIKKYIYTVGPVVGGFLVYSNFMSGAFTHTSHGVYLETGIYDDPDNVKFDDSQISPDNYKGSHAVCIVGWGVAKNIIVDNKGTKKDIPYWVCRNSWKNTWGDRGYFKIAMYPINKTVQFENIVYIQNPEGQQVMGGGIIIGSPGDIITKKLGKIDNSDSMPKLQKDDYYKTLPNLSFTPTPTPVDISRNLNISYDTIKYILIILCILILLGFIFLIKK